MTFSFFSAKNLRKCAPPLPPPFWHILEVWLMDDDDDEADEIKCITSLTDELWWNRIVNHKFDGWNAMKWMKIYIFSLIDRLSWSELMSDYLYVWCYRLDRATFLLLVKVGDRLEFQRDGYCHWAIFVGDQYVPVDDKVTEMNCCELENISGLWIRIRTNCYGSKSGKYKWVELHCCLVYPVHTVQCTANLHRWWI